LSIDCQGSGSPTLIMESGNSPDDHSPDVWLAVAPDLLKTNRVCFYDRAGNGWSDRRPNHRVTVAAVVSELDALLVAEGAEPPYVLVAHSFGGVVARAFAIAHPSEVTGMVLVDAL
jgi:pimeloyl-ACP methyl ester carboxylesterase